MLGGSCPLHGWVLFDHLAHTFLISGSIFLENVVCICLRRRFGIGVVQQVLNSNENLLQCDRRAPGFFFIQDREANGARGIDIRVEEGRSEFAYVVK